MKIDRTNENESMNIECIPDGAAFEIDNEIWIATKEYFSDDLDYRYRRCVRLGDGYVNGFSPVEEVKLINAKVVIE